MIPKIIHYCWFGGKPLPDEVKKYMETWKKYCPYYEITEWNESNFDVNQNQYCREAYEAGKWAFVSDYARLKILYDYGGIYMDTDMEVCKPLDSLASYAFWSLDLSRRVKSRQESWLPIGIMIYWNIYYHTMTINILRMNMAFMIPLLMSQRLPEW